MQRAAESGISFKGLRLQTFRPGEDEGSIEMSLADAQSATAVLNLNLLVSDPSDYPKGHSFFSYCPDGGPPDLFREILDDLATASPRPIATTIERLVTQMADIMDPSAASDNSDDDEDDADDGDIDYDAFDYDVPAPATNVNKRQQMLALQRDFLECIASGYTPGIERFSADDFCVSASIPVARLADTIPPRALVAWDRRLLEASQHLTLLIGTFHGAYPGIDAKGNAVAEKGISADLHFKVGLTRNYKPSKDVAKDTIRTFGLLTEDAEDELLRQKEAEEVHEHKNAEDDGTPPPPPPKITVEEDEETFDRFSLTNSLESLMENSFLKVLQTRNEFGLGWAGAELLLLESDRLQRRPEDLYRSNKVRFVAEDKEERKLAKTVSLPEDPLRHHGKNDPINLPCTAYAYLLRRLSLCTRYCLVCHTKINTEFEALKPYVCDSALCHYQYHMLNRGPSLEYEIIHNTSAVDLLVALAYAAASGQVLDDPLPNHLGLRVPVPDNSKILPPAQSRAMGANMVAQAAPVPLPHVEVGPDGLCEFDKLDVRQMRYAIAQLIESLPAVLDMRKHLMRRVGRGKSRPKLASVKPDVLPAAWTILRWCVASCRSYLEEITDEKYLIKNINSDWRQFRFTVGAPDAEARFRTAVQAATKKNLNAQKFPSIFAFHGSSLRNWHSILRHGLWYKEIANGRAYGNGVYFAKDGQISMGTYAQSGKCWSKSMVSPAQCTALAEIVNLPGEFVSSNPYLVVQNTEWIMCRYLLVRFNPKLADKISKAEEAIELHRPPVEAVPLVPLDPAQPLTMHSQWIAIPDPSHQIDSLLAQRVAEQEEVVTDQDDRAVFEFEENVPTPEPTEIDPSTDGEAYEEGYDPEDAAVPGPLKDDWKHDARWVEDSLQHLMPPPVDANPSATMAVQRELRAMLKEQEKASSLRDLGWYMPPDCISDNIFQWIVELHSFDPDIPIAQDMKREGVNSLIFEIRFPPTFPIAPPFFRIIKPRFLPFIHGGGGHVTGGGSICMDLLTSDGWLPSYSISAVLMQIKLAISNLDPRPARLSPGGDWSREYTVREALEGYKRAAATHGWTVPPGFEKMLK
ncbi:hypothetical protein HDZ31DRAFT_45014 [Schizophyllum fasciatum]